MHKERRMRLIDKRKVDIREKVLMPYEFLVQLFSNKSFHFYSLDSL